MSYAGRAERSHCLCRAIVRRLLGFGEKLFAIPWQALKLGTDHKRFILDIEPDRLANAPGFDKAHWPAMADPQWAASIYSYYNVQPYWEYT